MSWDRQEAANNATAAAMSTVRLIVEDLDLRSSLIGLPIFMHAMIAVCASFLLKLAVAFGEPTLGGEHAIALPGDLTHYGLNFQTKTALTSVERLVQALEGVADKASERHVARQVVTGLSELLSRFSTGQTGDNIVYSQSHNKDSTTTVTNLAKSSATLNDICRTPIRAPGIRSGQPAFDIMEAPQGTDSPSYQQGLFDLTGDLDWRFDDGFLLGVDGIDSEMPYL